MQADAEHQQDDADFGELVGELLIGDEPRRKGPDGDTGKQITDQKRHTQPMRRQSRTNANVRPIAIMAIRGVSCPGTNLSL